MNCKHVEELLPLYVGRDLEEKRAELIAAHVQSCTQCARSAEEYAEAKQLMQLFEAPAFDETVYAGIRNRVLSEIERESKAPRLLQFLARLFQPPLQPRVMWTVSTALLLAVCVFAFYFIANRPNGLQYEQRAADSQGNQSASSPSFSSKEGAGLHSLSTEPAAVPGATVVDARVVAATQRSERRKAATRDRTRPAMFTTETPSPTAQASLQNGGPVEPDDAPLGTSSNPAKTLRVEMQTSDRNIRIIWFSNLRPQGGSSRETSKGI